MTINIDINVSAIIRGEQQNREKAIAFEIFANDKPCYQYAFIPTRAHSVGNIERAEVLGANEALALCASQLTNKTNINVFVQEDGALQMLNRIETKKVNDLVAVDSKRLESLCDSHFKLIENGCNIKYNQRQYRKSTLGLAKAALAMKKDVMYMDEIQEVISSIKNTSTEDVQELEEVTSSTCSNSFLTRLNDEFDVMLSKEKELDKMILEAEAKLRYIESYNDSITHLNTILEEENDQLAYDVKENRKYIYGLDCNIISKGKEFTDNKSEIEALEKKMIALKEEISNIKKSDLALISYLQREIEMLILKTNLPTF